MRKITILEVLDPVKNEFIPIRQAINQGLFDTKTYLFYDPIEQKKYSITEAAKLGLFKSAIDLRPEALIVERIKVAESVSLISARDPMNTERLIPIRQAIELGIIDTNLRIYRNTITNKVIEFNEAIDSDLIQIQVIRETTEKVTETLTEQKNPDNPENLGILKKIETHTYGSPNDETLNYSKTEDNYIFDRTKSLSINKMMKKYNDEIAAGFITDFNSTKILPSDTKSLSPIIDFNDAVEKNLIILPDSLSLTQNVLYVLDLNTGNKFDFDAACEIGLIDVKNKTFYDTQRSRSISLFEALEKNYIVMKNELYTNYDQDELDEMDTNRISYLDLTTIFDPSSGLQINVKKAIEKGILSRDKQFYVDLYSGKKLGLSDAVEKGLAVLKPEKIKHKINEGYQFLHISGVHNPITQKVMSLTEAINAGLLNYAECEFHDPLSGKTLTLLDAYDKGYLITKTTEVDESEPETVSLVKSANSTPKTILRPSRRSPDYQEVTSERLSSKIQTNPEVTPRPMPKSHSVSPQRITTNQKIRSASSYDVKSLGKLSTISRKSVITRLKDKMLGKKSKYNRFDEFLIQESMKFTDLKTNNSYQLKEAIERGLLKPEDRILNTMTNEDFSIEDSIKSGLIKFFHPLNNFEFKYNQSCSIFNNEYVLLVNYVSEPGTRRKIGLKTALNNQVIDRENCVYFKLKKPISLIEAIERGYLSCEIIDLSLLNSIITSNIFKLYQPSNKEIIPLPSTPQPQSPPPPPIIPRDLPPNEEETQIQPPENEEEFLADKKGIISKSILEISGLIYDPHKDYCISEVYDSDKDKFVSLKKAIFLQIFDKTSMEYIDSRTGNSISLLNALQKKKIKIKEYSRKKSLASSLDYDEIYEDTTKSPLTSTLKSSPAYESLHEDSIIIPNLSLNETDSIKSYRTKTEAEFDITKCLLYKKATNGKYIRFERVIKNRLFDTQSGKVKDLKNDEYYDLYEALKRGLFRINDPNSLFDESRLYIVDSVLFNSRKIGLNEALDRKIIDKSKGTYKFLGNNFTFHEAFKQNYIEAKLITFNEVKWALEDYARRLEEKMSLKKTIIKTNESDMYTPVKNTTLSEYFIYDGTSDCYISINEAFVNGILLTDPIRIKDPLGNNYYLLKDAVIKGLVSCEAKSGVNIKNKSSFLAHNRKSYIIDSIYEPRKQTKYSLQDASKTGVFSNGVYKNFIEGKSYSIDEALKKGFILGRQINFDVIELSFRKSLGQDSSPIPPSKPSRGVFIEEEKIEKTDSKPRARSLNVEKRQKRSNIQPFSGRIVSIQDVISGKYLKVDDAEKFGLINFIDDSFKNSLTNETMKINEAMERGFILVESNYKKLELKKRSQSLRSADSVSEDYLETSRVEMGQQFDIISVLDPINREHLNLDQAIQTGLFDVSSAMYIDPRTKKRLTLVDAIDLNLIKIGDSNFRPSYKLVIEEKDRNFVKNIKTLSIRFIVDSFTNHVIPVNAAVKKKLLNLDNGTYVSNERIMNLKEAYDKFLAFTCEDLDSLESKRAKFRVAIIKKSTTGKNMSLKSALAKNWLNLDRRVYIDKQTNQEIPFSQAVDMDLLILKSNLNDKDDAMSTSTSVFGRSKSKDGFFNDSPRRIY
ncbi:unnamed protein product [Brachionus calyciflorus]|uniref:Uncharacterized protein n=1 Tax=Brachionus calyciflorus TaxID=104777 RepID=A0A813M4Y7_9BILA|nr:unnamed protein product [Brachionus calyciflorus]